MSQRLLVVGATGGSHIGGSFHRAALELGFEVRFCNTDDAWCYGTFRQKILWRLGGRRPVRLRRFGDSVVQACATFRPHWLVTTGSAPLSAAHLTACGRLGVQCLNFSTDDPFNPAARAPWFLAALPKYHVVFTPRHANEMDLQRLGCPRIAYVPFGYDPSLFFPTETMPDAALASDLMFAGAADSTRVPYVAAALNAGLHVRLYGINWDRYAETRGVACGQADIPVLRSAIRACRVALCVVRHENRDGHAMRTYEIPAVGACLVVEDTTDHRELFGPSEHCVSYFSSPAEMVARTRWLLEREPERQRRAQVAHYLITQGNHSYSDRLKTMLEFAARSS